MRFKIRWTQLANQLGTNVREGTGNQIYSMHEHSKQEVNGRLADRSRRKYLGTATQVGYQLILGRRSKVAKRAGTFIHSSAAWLAAWLPAQDHEGNVFSSSSSFYFFFIFLVLFCQYTWLAFWIRTTYSSAILVMFLKDVPTQAHTLLVHAL